MSLENLFCFNLKNGIFGGFESCSKSQTNNINNTFPKTFNPYSFKIDLYFESQGYKLLPEFVISFVGFSKGKKDYFAEAY